jgi:hypothetical protein
MDLRWLPPRPQGIPLSTDLTLPLACLREPAESVYATAAVAVTSEEADMRRILHRARDDRGMVTAEYAVATIAAVAFAAVLYKVVTSPGVMSALARIVRSALEAHL